MIQYTAARVRHVSYCDDVKYRMILGVKPQPGYWKGRPWSHLESKQVYVKLLGLLELVSNDGEVVHSEDHGLPAVLWEVSITG